MTRHIHLHLHDAGTPEGAKKAAQTRKLHATQIMQHRTVPGLGTQSRGTGHYEVHHETNKIGTISPSEIRSGMNTVGRFGGRGITQGGGKITKEFLGHHEPTNKRFSGKTVREVLSQMEKHHFEGQ